MFIANNWDRNFHFDLTIWITNELCILERLWKSHLRLRCVFPNSIVSIRERRNQNLPTRWTPVMPAITAVNLSQSIKKFCVDHLSVVWGVCWEWVPVLGKELRLLTPPEDSVFLVWDPLSGSIRLWLRDMGHLPRVTKSSPIPFFHECDYRGERVRLQWICYFPQ